MTEEVAANPPKRKVLGLRVKREPEKDAPDTKYVLPKQSVFMVWNSNGDMPKRVYKPEEQFLACKHAQALASQTGERFYVMRAWRGFEPA